MIALPFDWKAPEGLAALWFGIAKALGYRIERSPDGGTNWDDEYVDGWTLYYPSGTTDFIDDDVLRSIAATRVSKTIPNPTREDFEKAAAAALTEEAAWVAWRDMKDGDGYLLPQWGRSLEAVASIPMPTIPQGEITRHTHEYADQIRVTYKVYPKDVMDQLFNFLRSGGSGGLLPRWELADQMIVVPSNSLNRTRAYAAVWAAAWYQCHLTLS